MEYINENILLKNKINELEKEITELKEHLKKYTAPTRYKKYYENHKDELLQKNKEYREKNNYQYIISSDKKKEYNKKAYLKKKLEKEDF
jgi:hypothetical protein